MVDKMGSVCRDHSLAALASREMPRKFSEAVSQLAKASPRMTVVMLWREQEEEA